MSTDLATLQNLLPADLMAQLQAQAAADLERLGAIGGKDTIRVTQDKKFELPDGSTTESLEASILDFVYFNEYFLELFNRKEVKPPACYALSDTDAGLKPSDKSPLKQSEFCGSCQQNQFGSSPTGGGKACKNGVRLALLPPDADLESPIMTIKVSPTAIKHFNAYVAKVTRTLGVPLYALRTKIFFDPNETYASIRFEAISPNANAAAMISRREEARHRLMQEPDVSTFELPTTGKKK